MKFDKKRIKKTILDYREKIIDFLRSDRFRRIAIFLFFLFLAFCFWLLKTFRDDFTYNYRIPVTTVNLSPEIAIINSIPEYIQISVNAKGYDIFRYNHKDYFDTISIDLSQIRKDQESFILTSDELTNDIKKQLYNDTRLISLYPSHIQINFALKASKQVPVKLNANIVPASRFQRMVSGNISITPVIVTAYGPQSVIDTLSYVPTSFFELKDLLDTLQREVTLQTMEGIRFIPDIVDVFIPIEGYTEKIIPIPVMALNEPSDVSIRVFPREVDVSFTVLTSKYKQVEPDDFEVTVDYLEFQKDEKKGKFSVYLSKFPNFVQNIRINPAEVTIVLEEKAEKEHD